MTTAVGRGAVLGVLTVVAERGVSFLTLVLIARVLEPEGFGLYVYLLAWLMPIQVMSDQGLEVAATGFMARRSRAAASALAMLLAGRLLVWLGIGLPVAWLVLPALAGCSRWTAIVASACMIVGPSLPLRSVHRARGEMATVWRIATVDAVTTLVATGVALAAGGGVAGVFTARALVGIAVTIWAAARARTWPRPAPRARRLASRMFSAAWPLALNAALLTFLVRAGHLVAMTMLGAGAVGVLGAAARVAEMLSMLAEGVMLAAFPAMAAEPRRAGKVAEDAARALGLLVAWAVAVTAAGADALVALVYGAEYAEAGAVLAILAWGGLVSSAGAVIFYRLVAGDRQRLLLRVNASAAVVALMLQVGLVWAVGVRGAAVGTVLTLALGQVLLCTDPKAVGVVTAVWRRVAPCAVVAVGTIAAARVVAGGWASLAVALVVYPLASLLAGLVGPAERRMVAAMVATFRARVAGRGEDR